jgi:hypothetical protein
LYDRAFDPVNLYLSIEHRIQEGKASARPVLRQPQQKWKEASNIPEPGSALKGIQAQVFAAGSSKTARLRTRSQRNTANETPVGDRDRIPQQKRHSRSKGSPSSVPPN